MITCLQLRNQSIPAFFALPNVSEFIVETILGSPSAKVRSVALEQLKRLSRLRLPRSSSIRGAAESRPLLTKLILKAPVPLWMPSCKARGMSHPLLGQCSQYFDLRCYLVQGLSQTDQDSLEERGVHGMLEDELTFLHSFAPCSRTEDCTLLAGH